MKKIVIMISCIATILVGCNNAGSSVEKLKEITYESINGHDYVDLGLPSGTKWATCNVGANAIEEYGDYYAWGETTTKSSYTDDNCSTNRWRGGVEVHDIGGNPIYDVARDKWGSSWRLPTFSEANELDDECTWEYTTLNGINGAKVTGPNGNSIFLPAGGLRYYSRPGSECGEGKSGNFWTSTTYDERMKKEASCLYFYPEKWDGDVTVRYGLIGRERYMGYSVRPVSD